MKACKVLFLISLLFSSTLFVQGQCVPLSLPSKSSPLVSIDVKFGTFDSVLKKLMVEYGIVVGFEEARIDHQQSDFLFEVNPGKTSYSEVRKDGTLIEFETSGKNYVSRIHFITVKAEKWELEKLLDAIASQMPNYRWEITAGVVNFYPRVERNEKFKSLLEWKISRFHIKPGQTVGDITRELIANTDLQKALKNLGLRFNGARGGADFEIKAKYGRTIEGEVLLSDATLRDILNEAAKKKGCGGWQLIMKRPTSDGVADIDIDI